ncbi:MAG: hypothetical protein LBD12_06070 [Clostridiales Family XIII bacterium]|jgi:hypothetical protein|nr:hypothetical protein [Clostridiales Family XIII bacterium]
MKERVRLVSILTLLLCAMLAAPGAVYGEEGEIAIDPGSLVGKGVQGSGVEIRRYDFFPEGGENDFSAVEQARIQRGDIWKQALFTTGSGLIQPESPALRETMDKLPSFQVSEKYAVGRYHEERVPDHTLLLIIVAFAILFGLSFLAARYYHRHRRKRKAG